MTDSLPDLTAEAQSLLDTIRRRRSIRQLDPDRRVPDAWVDALLEAAMWAPSAGNRQPWRFIAITDRVVIRELGRASYGQTMFDAAPLTIAVVAQPERSAETYADRGRHLYCLQDTAAATQNLLLLAHSLGLGAVWVGAFDEAAATAALELPDHERPVALIPLGFPLADPAPRPRRPLQDIVQRRP